jgi:hypothetical protein
MRNFGDSLSINASNDTLPIGTLGADGFQNKVLIIDYPNEKFAVCDSVPEAYQTEFINMEFGVNRKIVIPMVLRGKSYRVTFDNGSSMFPLVTQGKYMDQFS